MTTHEHDGHAPAHGGDRSATAMGIGLWALVLAGLTYGVVNTLSKVVDLFSG
jgi:hypothetical protein